MLDVQRSTMERLDVAKTPFCRVVVGARVLEKVIAGTVTDLEDV